MNTDDPILLSVDNHVVEPPDLFDGRLSAAAAAPAPHIVRNNDGRDI